MKHILNTFLNKNEKLFSPSSNLKNYFRQDAKPVVMDALDPLMKNEPGYTIRSGDQVQHLSLRFGKATDVAVLVQMEMLVYDGYLAWREPDFQQDFQRNPYRIYLILEGPDELSETGHVYGIISGRIQARKAHISHVMIHPDMQNKGIGHYLLTKWIDYVESLDVPRIELEVRESNAHAQHLYDQAGFKHDRTLRAYYHDNLENAWRMSRDKETDAKP